MAWLAACNQVRSGSGQNRKAKCLGFQWKILAPRQGANRKSAKVSGLQILASGSITFMALTIGWRCSVSIPEICQLLSICLFPGTRNQAVATKDILRKD